MRKEDTIITIVISGVFALLGTAIGGIIEGLQNVKLAEHKYQSDLVLKALESESPEERLQTLKLLVHTNLIKESSVRDSILSYIEEKKDHPELIPQIKSVTPSLDAPIVDNARIYLLAGSEVKSESFTAVNSDLEKAGFKIMGKKVIKDVGRQDGPEIRFFNPGDKDQSEKIAEFLKFKLNIPIAAKQYDDKSARPGYIEIWMGR